MLVGTHVPGCDGWYPACGEHSERPQTAGEVPDDDEGDEDGHGEHSNRWWGRWKKGTAFGSDRDPRLGQKHVENLEERDGDDGVHGKASGWWEGIE